ncbi:glycosyltransferase family 39 protein, partial [Candidatus Aminicenantes bacterium AC-334-K16]|nr:glycosyltransferase family 39 protein [Candidatus Aminicenantes bacterium AC-334-K16]
MTTGFFEEKDSLLGRIIVGLFLVLLVVFVGYYFSRNLNTLSLWMDEGFHTIAAQEILNHGYPLFPSGHIYYKAILYTYLLALFSLIFGLNPTTLRIISVLATAASIPFLFAFSRKLFNKFIAFSVVVLFVLSLWVVENSRLALYFSPLLLVCLMGYYFFYLGFIEERPRYKVIATIVFILAPLVHQLGMSLWFSFFAFFIIRGARRFFRKDVLLSFTAISVFYVLIQVHEFFFWKVGYVYEKTELSFRGMVNYFFTGFSLGYFKELFRSFPTMSLFVFGGALMALVSFYVYKDKQNGNRGLSFTDNWIFVNLCLLFPLLFLGFFRTHVQPRYLYQLFPLYLILFVTCLYVLSLALLTLLSTSFNIKNPAFLGIVQLLVFLLFLGLFSEKAGLSQVKKVVNRYYKDPIPTDTITRSGRFEHYDHQGVGEFVRHFRQPDDIVVAIHVVFQHIYAGKVDYWLWSGGPGTWDAWEKTPEGWKDFYVGARWINNLQDLQALIASYPHKRIWIITSPSLYRRDHISPAIRRFI